MFKGYFANYSRNAVARGTVCGGVAAVAGVFAGAGFAAAAFFGIVMFGAVAGGMAITSRLFRS